ncbi:MAG: chemotaxis protein CheW [Thalassotalea sp.]
MTKSLAASQQLMQTYLSELLTEEEVAQHSPALKEQQDQALDKLLSQVSAPQAPSGKNVQTLSEENVVPSSAVALEALNTSVETANNKASNAPLVSRSPVSEQVKNNAKLNAEVLKTHKSSGGFAKQKSYRQGDFQAMFFDVAGLTIAVPLIELGGIHKSDKITALMGKPDWFKGVMLHRDEKINVVDTARWVMPEKCDEALVSALKYQYIIMLSNSSWGLSAENLVDTQTLKQDEVKWLDSANKRPWLAGLVKNRMCALVDVESLIKLLEKGVNISQE